MAPAEGVGCSTPGSGGNGQAAKNAITGLEKGQGAGTNPLRPVSNAARGRFNEKCPFEA